MLIPIEKIYIKQKNILYSQQIEELSKNEKEKMDNIQNQLNQFIEEQNEINKKNREKIEELNQKLEEKNRIINISGLGDNSFKADKNMEDKIINLENKIGVLNEVTKRLTQINEQNNDKVDNSIKDINDWMNNFHQTVQNKLKDMKNYIDKKINNLSSSQFNQFNTESNQNNNEK